MIARRILILVALVLMLGVAPARAGTVTFDPWQAGLSAAVLHWGRTPPCWPVGFIRDAPADTMPPGAEMSVTPTVEPCTIRSAAMADAESPWQICSDVVHEVGHLLGYQHSTDPADIMYPIPPVDWACRRLITRRRYAERCVRSIFHSTTCWPVYQWVLREPAS